MSAPPQKKRFRILYVERARGVGGSVISMYTLIAALDKSRYEPVVLFQYPFEFQKRFEALGVRTIEMNKEDRRDRAEPVPPDSSLRSFAANFGPFESALKSGYRSTAQVIRMVMQDLPLARKFARLIKDEQIDLVHNNNSPYGNRATVLGARLAQKPQICHFRTLNVFTYTELILSRMANYAVFISKATEQYYRDYGINPSRIRTIYNPIDTQIFDGRLSTDDLFSELGLKPGDTVISNVGRLDWWKGHDYFLQSLPPVVKRYPKLRVLIVGTSNEKAINKGYVQRLHDLVKELNLDKYVLFTGHRSDIPQIMELSDVVVHSASEPEPFGRVVAEAMLLARPVIATAAGGPLEQIEHNETGLLVPPKDIEAMSQAILEILGNSGQAYAMAQRARKVALERYATNIHVAAVQQLYDELLGAEVDS